MQFLQPDEKGDQHAQPAAFVEAGKRRELRQQHPVHGRGPVQAYTLQSQYATRRNVSGSGPGRQFVCSQVQQADRYLQRVSRRTDPGEALQIVGRVGFGTRHRYEIFRAYQPDSARTGIARLAGRRHAAHTGIQLHSHTVRSQERLPRHR